MLATLSSFEMGEDLSIQASFDQRQVQFILDTNYPAHNGPLKGREIGRAHV